MREQELILEVQHVQKSFRQVGGCFYAVEIWRDDRNCRRIRLW